MTQSKIHSLRASPTARRSEFSDFYDTTYPSVAAEILALTGNPDIAHAAVTASYVRAWQAWPTVRTLPWPVMWVRSDVVSRVQRPRWMQRLAREHPDNTIPLALDPEDEFLVDALGRVAAPQRVSLVLHYVARLPVPDIVDWFGGTPDEVDARLDQGFGALVRLLGGTHDTLRDRPVVNAEGRDLDGGPDAGDDYDWTAMVLEDSAHRFRRYVPTSPPALVFRQSKVRKVTRRGALVTSAAGVASVGLVLYFSPAPQPTAEAAALLPSGPGAVLGPWAVPGAEAGHPAFESAAVRPVAGTTTIAPGADVATGSVVASTVTAKGTAVPRSTAARRAAADTTTGTPTTGTTTGTATTSTTPTTPTTTTPTTTTGTTTSPTTATRAAASPAGTTTSTTGPTTTSTGTSTTTTSPTTTTTTTTTTDATATTSSSASSTSASTSEPTDPATETTGTTGTTSATHGHTTTPTDDAVDAGGTAADGIPVVDDLPSAGHATSTRSSVTDATSTGDTPSTADASSDDRSSSDDAPSTERSSATGSLRATGSSTSGSSVTVGSVHVGDGDTEQLTVVP